MHTIINTSLYRCVLLITIKKKKLTTKKIPIIYTLQAVVVDNKKAVKQRLKLMCYNSR